MSRQNEPKKGTAVYMDIKKLDEQIFVDGGKVWRITRLIQLALELTSFDIPLKQFSIYNLVPTFEGNSPTKQFIDYIKRIHEVNLSYPIILDDEGFVMDGRHRVFKALLENAESIKAVRFEKTPVHDYLQDEKKG